MTESVVLTVGLPADTAEAVAFNYTLKTFTFGSTDNVDIDCVGEYIGYSQDVA